MAYCARCRGFSPPRPPCAAELVRDLSVPPGVVVGIHEGNSRPAGAVCGGTVCACGWCQRGHRQEAAG